VLHFFEAKRQILWGGYLKTPVEITTAKESSQKAWTMTGASAARVFGIVALGAACCLLAAVWSGGASGFVELFADPGETARAQKQWRELVKSEETNDGQAVRMHGAHSSNVDSASPHQGGLEARSLRRLAQKSQPRESL